jgi:formylglycine-generating enzyme required for sulfatase activity/tRNA A-37 threonylcarbamoyl transferase component Bud32
MLPAIRLIDFGMRQVVGLVPDAKAREALAKMTGPAIQLVVKHFTDHSKTLPAALVQANDRAWQAVSVALAGDGFLDQIKLFFASADDKGIREQVRRFLQDKSIGYGGTPADFRKKCLTELNLAKNARLLTLSPNDVVDRAANFQRYADPTGMVDGAEQVIGQIADDFASSYPNLAKLLRQRPSGGPPLLVSAFSFFFRRAVETNGELARGLFFDGLRQMSAAQDKAFDEVGQALNSLGSQFDQVFEQLDRIENVGMATHTVVVETQEAVPDIQAEMQRLGDLPDEFRRLFQEIMVRVGQAGMQKGEVKPQHSFSIRSEDERNAVKQLLARFRHLPSEQQKQVPALLNGLGKLQFGSQDFEGARQTFVAVADEVHDAAAQAEAHFNAYRAALEEKKWDAALAAMQRAAALDAQRFAPFPMQRYQVREILGAGGFGTAFRCHDRNFDEEVVVKTLHDGAMERNMADVFREARLLRKLNHPAIIGVHECEYADPVHHARPYIVMDYFAGGSLENFIQHGNMLSVEDMLLIARQIAQGMLAAHQQGILHRDIKPDNMLIRKEGSTWKVKIIDFGLALRKQTIETSMAARSAGNTILSDSVAGTVKYAPPEQMGEMKGVKPGPYSDVYSFGKMCCYAMFKTTEPKDRHWKAVPESIRTDLKEMMDQCREEELVHRLPSFEPVLKVLEALDPMEAQRKKEEEGRQEAEMERRRRELEEAEKKRQDQEKAELERKRREQAEAERQRQQLERLQRDGEAKLIQVVREALDRNNGKLVQADATAANETCKQHRIPTERAKQIVAEVKDEWQKAHPPKTERKPGEIITNSLGMKFAWIPPETFLMGSPKNEEGREPYQGADEFQHKVTLTKGFFMGIQQVTRGQFATFVQKAGFKTQAEREGGAHIWTDKEWKQDPAANWRNPGFEQTNDHPVTCVSWNDAVAFAEWLAKQDNKRIRLPSEAEWEYACRARTTTPFHFGETISTDQANFDGNYTYGKGTKGKFRQKTTPVGSFPANAWGLFDMHGNLWDWCQDWFGEHPRNDVVDPQGPESGQYRVLRGGSWISDPENCRSACRNGLEPAYRFSIFGLRVCFCLD